MAAEQPSMNRSNAQAAAFQAATHLKEGLQLSKVEVGVEARGLVPDGALLGGLDLVPMQLLQLPPLAGCWPHLCMKQDDQHFSETVKGSAGQPLYGWVACASGLLLGKLDFFVYMAVKGDTAYGPMQMLHGAPLACCRSWAARMRQQTTFWSLTM